MNLPPNDKRESLMAELMGIAGAQAVELLEVLNDCLDVPGDVCEFGVAQGATSALMANEIAGTDKGLWLFDSFEGLPAPTAKDVLLNDIFTLGSMAAYEGQMAVPMRQVNCRLMNLSFPRERYHIIPGFIEETIVGDDFPQQVAFAVLDFDFYEPTAIALAFVDRVLSPGGAMFVDDYGYFSQGVKTAVDEFMVGRRHRYEFIERDGYCLLKMKGQR